MLYFVHLEVKGNKKVNKTAKGATKRISVSIIINSSRAEL